MSWRSITIKPEDAAFSLCVRERARWTCEHCGKRFEPEKAGLDCSHWITRKHLPTRWHPRNAFAMCKRCHEFCGLYEGYDKWRPWLLSDYQARPYTEEELDKLLILSRSTLHAGKVLRQCIRKHYMGELKKLREGAADFQNWSDADPLMLALYAYRPPRIVEISTPKGE